MKAILMALMATVALAQSPDTPTREQPKFEVVSIRPESSGNGQVRVRLSWLPGGRFVANGFTARMLIGIAYGAKNFQISGGPSWTERDGYSVEAKGNVIGKGPILSLFLTQQQKEEEENQLKLQALLAERFQLKFHKETRDEQVYSLVVAKDGPKLRAANLDGGAPETDRRPGLKMYPYQLTGTSVSLRYLAEELSRRLSRKVIDQTRLTGEFDFNLRWAPDAADGNSLPDGPSIFTAMQEQLGLKLESSKAPVDEIIIDHIEKPSGN